MMTYITAFIFYTMAMIGIMLLGFVIYKKTMMTTKGDTKGMIKILDSLPIGNKKNLLVVKIKNERFLIASGMEHTTFLSKLADDNTKQEKPQRNLRQQKEEIIDNLLAQSQTQENYSNPIDFQKQKLERIEKQFKELYSQNPIQQEKNQNIDRREMVRALLKDLNETTNAKTGSRF